MNVTPELRAKTLNIRLLCLDVDGVLTDGCLYWNPGGIWSQRFYVRDGFGIKQLQSAGITVAILSAGQVVSAQDRAKSLGIEHAHFGLENKLEFCRQLIEKLSISLAETAFIGDELEDVALLEQVGFSASVPDAPDQVRRAVHYVTTRRGGEGAVREIADLLLLAKA